ncbi:cystathionine gamma-synthase [Bacillus sp. FJAT-27225]|uniref:cystathionine beta-lyase n=1 Tax=Bacillus sp. FJAT-27225 TaxID=1743144 RepID=UPI00080C213F|nr:cystathionine beta-lyase [Bacillus sp. FJAT-27225]OCA90554.1 cystathionine gamma-synthase [Bacillus sp. FJAT-27225]
MTTQTYSFNTKVVNQQTFRKEKNGSANPPLYYSSTFHQNQFDSFGDFDYSRSGNPTRQVLEETIADLEGGVKGFAFSSGMAAISSAFMLLSAGDHVLISKDVYGGTFRMVTQVLSRFKIEHTFVDMTDLIEVARSFRRNTKVVYVETPSNPLLQITNIKKVAELSKLHGCRLYVDNTFLTPLYQKPLELGADLVLHSATKFLSGHSDVVAGLAVVKDEELANELYFIQNSFGAVLGVPDCYELLKGMKTLSVRIQSSSESAERIANFLKRHPLVEEVFYPGLSDHPGHSVHFSQATGAGAVLSFRLPNRDVAKSLVENLQLPVFAVSLGAVESILSYPATMSHAALPSYEREKRGITDGLLRLSVGLEDCSDILNDFENALSIASKACESSLNIKTG